MPYPLPNLRITPEQCFTDPKIYAQMADIIDLFLYMSTEAYPGLPKSWIDRFINNGEYNIYLTGGRAFHIVLNALKSKLNSPFWELFNWSLMDKLYAETCDYDIQCCWKNKVKLQRIDDVMLNTFNMMKQSIRAYTSTEASDTLFCSNGLIDIAWIQQPVNRIDFMNTSFRINLISGEVECLSEAGFKLLTHANQIDVPDIMKYIEQPKQCRALSKMTFSERTMAKAFKLNFILSDHTKEALDYATRKRSYAKILQSYNQQKFAKLRENHDDNKLAYINELAGNGSQSWLERILLQNRKNSEKFMPSLSHIPAANTGDILNNIKLIIGFNRKPRDQGDAIEIYLKDTLEYYISHAKLQELITELETLPSENNIYHKGLALCKKSLERMQPKSPVQTSPKSEPIKKEGNPTCASTVITSRIYQRKTKDISFKKLVRIKEIQHRITPNNISVFCDNLEAEYVKAYYDASVNFHRFINKTISDERDVFYRLPIGERNRLGEIRAILREDTNIHFASELQKLATGMTYAVIVVMTIHMTQRYFEEPSDCEPQDSYIMLLFKVLAFFVMFMIGIFRSNSISLRFLRYCGLDDNMRGLSQAFDKFQENSTDENHYKILIYVGMCIKFALDFMRDNEAPMISSQGSLFLKNPDMALGIERLARDIREKSWGEASRDALICVQLQAFAELDIKDLVLILSRPAPSLKGDTLEEIREELQDMLPALRQSTSQANHNGAQYETKHPLQSLQM